MDTPSTASIKIARVLLWSLLMVNVYRAATQSITPSEAFTWEHYVHPRLYSTLSDFNANNHILYTLFAKLSLKFVRFSEFALRLPAVVFGGLYLLAVYRLSRRIFTRDPLFLAAVALLTLNPLVLDYLSAARGYGAALALLLWSLVWMCECLDSEDAPLSRLNLAGLCLGACVAANLAFGFPAVALGAAFWIAMTVRRKEPAIVVVERFAVTALAAAVLLVGLPLARAEAGDFYYGAGSLRESLRSLLNLSLYHDGALFPGARPPLLLRVLDPVVRVGLGALVVVAAAISVRILRAWRRGGKSTDFLATPLALCSLTAALTSGLLVAAHKGLGAPYPLTRTAIYFIPLSALLFLLVANRIGRRAVVNVAIGLAALASMRYVWELDLRTYSEWPGCAESRTVVRVMAEDAGGRPIRIAASPSLVSVVNFYRERFRIRNSAAAEPKIAGQFDYYVLAPADAGLADDRHMRILYRDRGLTLARP